MKTSTAALAISLSLPLFFGCHSEAPKGPTTEPKATNSQPATNENADPDDKDCAAIKDPAQAEDCRMRKGIAAARKKHNSDPVVKHSPGSIQQP